MHLIAHCKVGLMCCLHCFRLKSICSLSFQDLKMENIPKIAKEAKLRENTGRIPQTLKMEKELHNLKSTLRALVVSSAYVMTVQSLEHDYRKMMGKPIPISKYGYRDIVAFIKEKCGDSFRFQGMPSNPEIRLIVTDCLKHLVKDQKPALATKKNTSSTQSKIYVPSHGAGRFQKKNKNIQKKRKLTPSEINDMLIYRKQMKSELYALLQEHEDGIGSTDILRFYRERYKRELDFNRAGYNFLTNLLDTMSLYYVTIGIDTLVRTTPWPVDVPLPPSPPPRPRYKTQEPVDPEDALPRTPYDPDVFPSDCMQLKESIPILSMADLVPGGGYPVYVREVYSPSHIWLQWIGKYNSEPMLELMDRMFEYYNTGEGRTRQLPMGATRVGHYCASQYAGDWNRSLIVKVIDVDVVKVRHIDFGTVDVVPSLELKSLLREYASLPAQAVRACLGCLQPAGGAWQWPHSASRHFVGLVQDQTFTASVFVVDKEARTIEVSLQVPDEDETDIAREMIRAGHADMRDVPTLRSGESYLLPTFDVLENGDTPNFTEICSYVANGICLEYVESYRRHVAPALPDLAPTDSLPARLSQLQLDSEQVLAAPDAPSADHSDALSLECSGAPSYTVPLLMQRENQVSMLSQATSIQGLPKAGGAISRVEEYKVTSMTTRRRAYTW